MAALSVVSGFASEVSDVAPGAVPAEALTTAVFGGAADTTATAALDSTSGVASVCVTGCFGAGQGGQLPAVQRECSQGVPFAWCLLDSPTLRRRTEVRP